MLFLGMPVSNIDGFFHVTKLIMRLFQVAFIRLERNNTGGLINLYSLAALFIPGNKLFYCYHEQVNDDSDPCQVSVVSHSEKSFSERN